MASTMIYYSDLAGDFQRGPTVEHGWGFAPAIWKSFAERYLGMSEDRYYRCHRSEEAMWQIWNLSLDPALPFEDRVTMSATFDRAVVRRRELHTLVRCFRATARWMSLPNNLEDQAKLLMEMSKDLSILAVGWYAYSVSEDLWVVPSPAVCPTCGRSSDEDEKVLYNLFRDQSHFFLFDELAEEGFRPVWNEGAGQLSLLWGD